MSDAERAGIEMIHDVVYRHYNAQSRFLAVLVLQEPHHNTVTTG
jgi:hypothetical protein